MCRIPFVRFSTPRLSQIATLLFALSVPAVPGADGAQVVLKWQDNSANETGFKIERAIGNTGLFVQIATKGSGVESHTDTTVLPSTLYRYRVRAYNSRGNSAYSNITAVTTGSSKSNTAPTISKISDRTIPISGTTGAISFTIGDAQTAASNLKLTKNSSNQALVPSANITFGGSGTKRTVTVRPVSKKKGWSTIWVKVSDGVRTSYTSFLLIVDGNNTAPTISPIANRTVPVNGTTGPIRFTIGDAQTSASSLTLIKNASDQSLVPLGNITFGGSGANRTVTVKPASKKTGWSTIWVKVSDGKLTNYVGFVITVSASTTTTTITASTASRAQITSLAESTAPTAFAGDELRFSHVPLEGDAELTVRVADLAASDDQTRGGLMFRQSTRGDAACAGLYVTGASRLVLVWRETAGASLQSVAPLTTSVPCWLRLTRVDDVFYGFASADGKNWDLVEFAEVDLPDAALGGTAATATGGASSKTASFENFAID